MTKFENCGVFIREGPGTEQVVKGNDTHRGRGRVCKRDMARVRVGHGMAGQEISCPCQETNLVCSFVQYAGW
jgi:hypothetical protein